MPPASLMASQDDERVDLAFAYREGRAPDDHKGAADTTDKRNVTEASASGETGVPEAFRKATKPILLPETAESGMEQALRNEDVVGSDDEQGPDSTEAANQPSGFPLNAIIQEGVSPKDPVEDAVAPQNAEEGLNSSKVMRPVGIMKKEAPPSCVKGPKYKMRKSVTFHHVDIREYDIAIGENPYCSYGVPICLDWTHGETQSIPIELFETKHKRKRRSRRMLLTSFQRRDMLWRSGYDLEEIEQAIKDNDREKFRRSVTLYFLLVFQLQEIVAFGYQKVMRGGNDSQKERRAVEEEVRRQQSLEVQRKAAEVDMEVGGMSITDQRHEEGRARRRLSFRSASSPATTQSQQGQEDFHNDTSLHGSSLSESSHDRDDPYSASINSQFKTYSIRVDRGQHDKATEIILCDFQRPHMRAFHASWFSFFIAFFTWFAVTPLLGEIQDSLRLSKADIWTSSLCGTAGTIIMRILMGPACDKFGARICMAFILTVSAIPCALTGLVKSSEGLSAVRSFVGIAGSSFVACQYWTSQMFTREVAGTANALAAGWGNLGGGVTQVVMGSVLFPLFEFIFENGYDGEDGPEDGMSKSELAWRTVFVIPALVALVTAYVVAYHCDDSPKGDYRERVRQQQISAVNPSASLCYAFSNWNVWILLFQYASCFGVEVTMTNATALYFKDEFGQTTVSAAAIASVFGFMNLFARGVGGFASDLFNAKFGMRGRILWQALTLFLEGGFIVIFGFSESLGGSILALVFLSCFVQSAEGSTFGIVPYVDRRFTGSVVGWVGAGGNVGGVIFAVFFREFSYKTSFSLMGIAASVSSFLSFFMNVKTFSHTQQWEMHEIGITKDAAIVLPDNHDKNRDKAWNPSSE